MHNFQGLEILKACDIDYKPEEHSNDEDSGCEKNQRAENGLKDGTLKKENGIRAE